MTEEQQQQMPWREAAIRVLREAYPTKLHDRAIALRILKQGLRTVASVKTAEAAHNTISRELHAYVTKNSNALVCKVAAAMWSYKPPANTPSSKEQRQREKEAQERERNSLAFKRDLVNFIVQVREHSSISAEAAELERLAGQLQRIRARHPLAQKLDFDASTQQINSLVIVGNTGLGKSHFLNCLLRLGSPLIDLSDASGNYAWNDAERTQQDQEYLITCEIDRVASQLSLMGISVEQQKRILLRACNGYSLPNDPKRPPLMPNPDKVLQKEFEIQKLAEERLSGWLFKAQNEIFNNPYLVATARNCSTSTTAYPTHIRYGGLPTSILVFKTPTQLAADMPDLNRNGTYTRAEQEAALKLCQENRVEVTIGNGNNFTLDRVYLRDKMIEQHNNRAYSLAVQYRIILFPDAALRNGSERVDTPGSGDENPICKKNLLALMETATQVVCLVSQGLENDSPMIQLLKRFYPKLLTDPLNHCLLMIEMPEKNYQVPNDREAIETFLKNNNDELARENAKKIIQRGLEEARQQLTESDIETCDLSRCQSEMFRFFPSLFLAQCLRYQKLKPDSPRAAQLLEQMRAIKALEVMGGLFKISYGYELRATQHFFNQTDEMLPYLPEPLIKPLRSLLKSMTKHHSALCDLALEASANETIGETLLKSGQSIFPKYTGNDIDCTLECEVFKNRQVGGLGIECTHCAHWYHMDCVNVDTSIDWSQRDWFCPAPDCKSQLLDAAKRIIRRLDTAKQLPTAATKRKSSRVPPSKRIKLST